ncbi:Leucine-rich repeat and transmembrane domain-containing protein 1 [Turdus rufiventris]|nr:Leucine-rich repeat and transmembrane domain-containing protein 1 [Turdus rufiventris]
MGTEQFLDHVKALKTPVGKLGTFSKTYGVPLGILAGARNNGAKPRGTESSALTSGDQKIPMEKMGLLSSQGFIQTERAALRKTLTGCKKKIVVSEDSNKLEKVAQKNDRICYCKYQSLDLTGPWITSGNWLLVWSAISLAHTVHGCPEKCLCNTAAKTADCKNRGFTEIPARLPPEIQILQLQNNRIWRINQNAFTATPLLKILDLSNNSVSSVAPGAFQKLRYLQVLNLTRNMIHYIENKTFSFLPHLKELDLSSNSIIRLPETFGNSTGNITLLSVKHNKLQKMERILLESLPNLKVVLFKDNPWQCNCNIFGLKLWLESFLYRGGISDGIICSAPGIRKGKELLKVPYELFGACSLRTALHLASSHHHHGYEHRGSLKHGPHGEPGDGGRAGCEPKAKARPVSLRHAIATVVITGVVCGIVCLMMLAAAVYGCAYAAITAKYHREHPARQHGAPEKKELLESSLP